MNCDVPVILLAHYTLQTTSARAMMNEVQSQEMTTVSAPVVLSEKVQAKFDELKEENFYDEDMYEFINEYGQDNFFDRYEDYVAVGEEYDYDGVDAFIEEFGIQSLTYDAFVDAYRGQYDSKADYAFDYVNDVYGVDLPGFVEVDWEATFDNMDEVFVNGYVFNSQF
jgi:hypothetical protein